MNEPGELSEDGVFKAAIGTLWFCGIAYLAVGVGGSCLVTQPALNDPGVPVSLAWTFGIAVFSVALGCAVGNFVAAWGLSRRKRWAWMVAVIIGGLYAPSGCFLFGALLLYAMLRSGVKERFEAEAALAAGAPRRF